MWFFFPWFFFILPATPPQAHPAHSSFAELGWNESGTQLEVALRVIPEDLETVLSVQAGDRVVLQDTPALRQLLTTWLARNFIVRTAGGEAGAIELAGMELAYDKSWLYFTVALPRQDGLTLENRILQDLASEREHYQLNQVQRLWRGPKDRLQFSAADLVQAL